MSTENQGGSRLPVSNSVEPSTARNQQSEEIDYSQEVAQAAAKRVREFYNEYPQIAHLPLSRTTGTKLRSELVDEEYTTEKVEGAREWDNGFTVDRLERAEPVEWGEAVFRFLTNRQHYDDGTQGHFEDTVTGETFNKYFRDCWTTEYADKQAARNAGGVRQLAGGEYPETCQNDALRDEYELGEWGDVATVMLTTTGSAKPGNMQLPPVDFANEIDTWSDHMYHVVRNVCEYHLGLDSEQWAFARGDDVHGVGGDGGINACYPHHHTGVYIDSEAADIEAYRQSGESVEETLERLFYPAIEKHVEECEIAEPDAHRKGKAVEANLELENPGAYVTAYLRLDQEEQMMDQEIELVAFAALEWATGRQRIARSQILNDAAKTDLCKQSDEHTHGERLEYRHGHGEPEVVCSHCGSPVGIDANTITEFRTHVEPQTPDTGGQPVVADGGTEEEVIGYRVGESTERARLRSRLERYVGEYGEPDSEIALLGELGIPPEPGRDVLSEVVSGENSGDRVEPIRGREREGGEARYQLTEIEHPDGSREEASNAGGGASFTRTEQPEEHLLQETRLQHFEFVGWSDDGERLFDGPHIVCADDSERFVTYNPVTAARWLVDRGYRVPWHAELALSFEEPNGDLESVFSEPESEPPGGGGG